MLTAKQFKQVQAGIVAEAKQLTNTANDNENEQRMLAIIMGVCDLAQSFNYNVRDMLETAEDVGMY
jgi:hypothetical protein